jgi:hypothetical protein
MRRTPLLLAAAASASLLLAGCGAATSDAAPAVAPAAATQDAPALADGLLPAEQFAPGSTVTGVTADDLAGALGAAAGHDPGQVTITPSTCTDALDAARAALGDPADVDDAAGQYAQVGFGGTAELLSTGGPAQTAVGTLADAVAACPTATLATDRGQAVVTFGAVTRPDLGDDAVVVPVSVTLSGGPVSGGSALLGLVSDGDRLLALATGAVGTTVPDQAAFEALLAGAQQHAADTLG